MPALLSQAKRVREQVQVARQLIDRITVIDDIPRQYVAELITVRIFALFESIVEDSACLMVCGAPYCDDQRPNLLRPTPTRGRVRALSAMRDYGRSDPRKVLRWNRARDISKNLEALFPKNEHFVEVLRGHGQLISDLRKVRNHIAHRNQGTRVGFQEVVQNNYGAAVPGLTPGRMLLSPRFRPLMVEQFCRKIGIVLEHALKAR